MNEIDKKVMVLDLNGLSQEDIDWLHELKNKAAAMQGRLQLKHLKEEYGMAA